MNILEAGSGNTEVASRTYPAEHNPALVATRSFSDGLHQAPFMRLQLWPRQWATWSTKTSVASIWTICEVGCDAECANAEAALSAGVPEKKECRPCS